jgi:molecular chaperone DnaK
MTKSILQYMDHSPSSPKKEIRVLGIDLGTTNSSVSEIIYHPDQNEPPTVNCLEIDQDTLDGLYTHIMIPSFVAVYQGRLFIGEGAKRLRGSLADAGSSMEYLKNIFWDCKNYMGLTRTFHKAPQGFNSAKEISAHLLKFMKQEGDSYSEIPVSRTVVTVPASFGVAQRRDTLDACSDAGIDVSDGELLDEPIAAFLDYLSRGGVQSLGKAGDSKILMVFDFGGGTCDIAIFRLNLPGPKTSLKVAPLSVSRYHRLGGGDIDLAIVHEVLLPQLCEQNNIRINDLDYTEKKNIVGPALLSLAESLKIGMCREISNLKQFNRYTQEKREKLTKTMPGIHYCTLKDGRQLGLSSPALTAVQFDDILKPFFEKDLLYPQESEYKMTCSMFLPIEDSLDRAGLKAIDVDYCLLVGGSTLIPQVQEEMGTYLPSASVLSFDDADDAQTSVSKGAAYQALTLELFGRGIIQPVSGDDISIRTSTGSIQLIPMGSSLPYPSSGEWAEDRSLTLPRTSLLESLNLRLELIDSQENTLGYGIWKIPAMTNKGNELVFHYKMDTNQVLYLRLWLKGLEHEEPFSFSLEKPLTNIVFPGSKRDRIDELEEKMRKRQIPREKHVAVMEELAGLYEELGHLEKALEVYKLLLMKTGEDDPHNLNKMGIICGNLKDYEREEKFFLQAAKNNRSSAPLFNLALSKKRQGKTKEALKFVNEALEIKDDPAYMVARATYYETLGEQKNAQNDLDTAMPLFPPVSAADSFHLSWMAIGARMSKDSELLSAIEHERKVRNPNGKIPLTGELPETKGAIVRSN